MLRVALLILASTLLAACATPKRAPDLGLTEDARAETIVLGFQQQEITVDKPDVNAGGGLLGAIIEGIAESTMDKNRQEALAPLRNALADYEFEPKLRAAIDPAWPSRYFADQRETIVVRSHDDWSEELARRNGPNLGGLVVKYAFSPDFELLYVHAGVRAGDIGLVRDKKGRPKEKYKSSEASKGKVVGASYYAIYPLADDGKFRDNAARWTAEGGRLAREALDAAVVEIADLIRRDLASPLQGDTTQKQRFLLPTGSGLLNMKGELVETRNGRRLLSVGSTMVWTASDESR
jgi:hypothetical protein